LTCSGLYHLQFVWLGGGSNGAESEEGGGNIGHIDETPKPLEEAKAEVCDRASRNVEGDYASPEQIRHAVTWTDSDIPL
jgi:hypothetical protein